MILLKDKSRTYAFLILVFCGVLLILFPSLSLGIEY